MTKERLEELINQKATIYAVYFNLNKVFEEELNECSWSVDKQGNLVEHYLDSSYVYKSYSLFETKDQAKWALKNYAERTERFEPPMWEDIEKEYSFNFFVGDNSYYFIAHKRLQNIDCVVNNHYSLFSYRDKECTKENYEKACEIVRDLFKGEK